MRVTRSTISPTLASTFGVESVILDRPLNLLLLVVRLLSTVVFKTQTSIRTPLTTLLAFLQLRLDSEFV